MNKKLMLILGIVLIIVSTIVAAFTDVANDIPAVATGAFGLGLTIAAIWQKSEKKDWTVIAAVICAVIGGFLCGIAGLAEMTFTSLLTAIGGVVALIISILLVTLKKPASS